MSKLRIAGYVKLAKLWERNAEQAREYHTAYYYNKYAELDSVEVVGVYVDITSYKEIYKRSEMLRLIRDCSLGLIDCIASQTRGYLAANTREFCYLIHYLFSLGKDIEIITEDDNYNINTAVNQDKQKEALVKMAEDYITLNPEDYLDWYNKVKNAIYDLFGYSV